MGNIMESTHGDPCFVLFLEYQLSFYLLIWPHWVLAVAWRIFSCIMWTLSCLWGLIAWPGIEHSPLHFECKVVAAGPSEKSPSGPFDVSLHLHPNPCLRRSYNGITVCNPLWLPAFRIMSVKFTHVVMCIGGLFILLLWGAPLHGYTIIVCPFFRWCTFELFEVIMN